MSLVVALAAAVALFVVRLQQGQLDLTRVVRNLEVEIPEAVLIETMSLVNERFVFLETQ